MCIFGPSERHSIGFKSPYIIFFLGLFFVECELCTSDEQPTTMETERNEFERKMFSEFEYHIKSASNVLRIWQIMLWACFVNEFTWKIGRKAHLNLFGHQTVESFDWRHWVRRINSRLWNIFSIVVNSMRETSATDTHRLQCELIVPRRCILW